MGATAFSGVATEVFRRAKNGLLYLDKVREMGIKISLISQEMEGEIGFNSVCIVGKISPRDAVVWDSGGASFQITSLDEHSKLRSYMGALGTSVSTGILLKEVRGDSKVDVRPAVNPVNEKEAVAHMKAVKERLDVVPTWLLNKGGTRIYQYFYNYLYWRRAFIILTQSTRKNLYVCICLAISGHSFSRGEFFVQIMFGNSVL